METRTMVEIVHFYHLYFSQNLLELSFHIICWRNREFANKAPAKEIIIYSTECVQEPLEISSLH